MRNSFVCATKEKRNLSFKFTICEMKKNERNKNEKHEKIWRTLWVEVVTSSKL